MALLPSRNPRKVLSSNPSGASDTVFALNQNGIAYAWGVGTSGQLGNSTAVGTSTPVSVSAHLLFSNIANMSTSTVALQADTGLAYCWGSNSAGQLGNNDTTLVSKSSPVSVAGGMAFNDVSGGVDWAVATDISGNLWFWGNSANFALPNVAYSSTSSPVSVNSTSYNKLGGSAVIEFSNGNIYCWGVGTTGQIGNNLASNQSSPTLVAGGRSWSYVATGVQNGAAIEASTGNAYMWGSSAVGVLGNNQTSVNTSSPISVFGGRSYSQITVSGIATSGSTAAALEVSTGNIYCWGLGTTGQIGNSLTASVSTPTQVSGGRSFNQVSAGGNGSSNCIVAIEAGTNNAYCWGFNSFGQLGNNGVTSQSSPTSVVGGRSYSKISTGSGVNVAAIEFSTGNAYCWGIGTSGQLGNNSATTLGSPVSVAGGRSYSQISAGFSGQVAAIEGSTGNAYCWGVGTTGQLGNGIAANTSSPVSVLGGRSYVQISCSESTATTYAIDGNGIIWSWGNGGNGSLGNGTNGTTNNLSPVSIGTVTASRQIGQIATSQNNGAILQGSTGNAYCWGSNANGQIGNNSILGVSSPTSVVGGFSFSQIASGGNVSGNSFFAGIQGSTGNLYTWGYNGSGQLGINTTSPASSPTSVFGGRSFVQVACGSSNIAAIEGSTGNLYTWGSSSNGQLGINQISVNMSTPVSVFGGRSFTSISVGADYMIAQDGAGVLWSWGSNAAGALANTLYTAGGQSNPVSVGSSYTKIGGAAAILGSTGNAYCWGLGTQGQIGNNLANSVSTPTQVTGSQSFSQISSSGDNSATSLVALEASTGHAYCWGRGTSGTIGNNLANNASTPTSVAGGRIFTQVAAGDAFNIAIDNIGTIYAWGLGSSGALGQGINTANTSSPVSVVGGRTYSQISASLSFSATIEQTTGNAYCWGLGGNGQLGNNGLSSTSSPVSVAGGRSFVQIAAGTTTVAAIEGSTGNMYTWGQNNVGALGINAVLTQSSSPVSVVGGRSWSKVSAGGDGSTGSTIAAIEASTGNAYCWGLGTSGQLGNGLSANASSPMAVLGGRSFVQISVAQGPLNVYAIDGNGVLWSWGSNATGFLGINTGVNALSPVSVGIILVPNM